MRANCSARRINLTINLTRWSRVLRDTAASQLNDISRSAGAFALIHPEHVLKIFCMNFYIHPEHFLSIFCMNFNIHEMKRKWMLVITLDFFEMITLGFFVWCY